MRGEAAEGVHLGFYRDALMEDFHVLGAVDDIASQRALGLETGKDQVAILAPEVVLEVVDNAPAGAHTAAGDDDCAALYPVYRHRFFRAWRAGQDRLPIFRWFYIRRPDRGAGSG